ncbi:putative lipid II flippase FtsW [Thermospira aquatica]|uniref:Probable peptidoglycan glycosyltransferase FtsW n=1 Tax=Thermospira aquatica TaxID=2828656 RepID=A0AAX3BAK1_9SPIR|nr:putative lipid II flippase FtsW [Thermospira aquatica]URA09244.1 putative lipid II flippase FtsW [Thermospira aquatica]
MLSKIDRALLYAVLFLMVLGILFVFSASSYFSLRYTGSIYTYAMKQMVFVLLGFGVMVFMAQYEYTKLRRWIKPLVFVIFLLLLLVFVPGLGSVRGGARRWIHLGFFDVNPAEFAKLVVVIYLSYIFTKKQQKLKDFTFGFLPPLLIVTAIFFIILMQSGFSIATLLLMVGMVMFFVGGASLKHLLSVFLLSLPVLVTFVVQVTYRKARILSFLNPWSDPYGKGYHLIQSYRAFADAGWFGKGLGNSTQKIGALPTPHTDFIYAVITEEMGLVVALLLLGVYLFIFLRAFLIAKRVQDPFGQLLAYGIASLFGFHVFLNIGVTTGLMPTTGVSLPFISYGGSSLLMFSLAMGILLNLSAHGEEVKGAVREIREDFQETFG